MKHARFLLLGVCCALGAACAVATTVSNDAGTDASLPDGSPTPDGGPIGDAKSDSATCASPLVHCSGDEAGVCTDLKTSVNHCGTCGTACTTADASALEAGSGNPDAGVSPPDGGWPTGPFWSTGTADCDAGACGVACPSNMALCTDGICYDTQNFHDHCGNCNTACQSTEYCALGHCCGAGTEWCGSSCVDVMTDNNNCGSCGHVCGTNLTCGGGVCSSSFTVEVFPPSGTLQDPGNNTYWSARYYTMTFATTQTITGIAVRANLSSADYIYGEIWDPNNTSTSLAKGSLVYGSNTAQFYKSSINYTLTGSKAYLVGVYFSNSNTVFPRKDTPSYPFTVTDQLGNITVSACWSTSTSNTDIFPTSTNYWAPDLKLTIQ